MSHTPGPWRYEEPDAVGLPHLRAANGDAIATFLRDPWNSSDVPLIAAAPELLEALEALLQLSITPGIGQHQRTKAINIAKAALAKARREEGRDG